MSGSDSYSWIGGTAGTWGDAANWEDLTAGTVAAMAPGIDNVVTIGADVTLSGTGSAASVTLLGDETILSNLNVGTLTADGALNIDAGGTIIASTGSVAGTIATAGSGDKLLVSGILNVAYVPTQATGGGLTQIGTLVATNAGLNPVNIDALSAIEFGNADTAAAGSGLTVDPGQTLSVSGQLGSTAVENLPAFPMVLVDNGVISSSNLDIGYVVQGLTVATIHLGVTSTTVTPVSFVVDTMSGTGTVEVQSGGEINVVASVTAAGLTFQLDGSATLGLYVPVAAGNTIVMNGSGDTLDISNTFSTDISHMPLLDESNPPQIGATIYGFGTSDALVVMGLDAPITSVAYNGGTLSLMNGGSVVSSLNLAGDYASDIFSAGTVTQVASVDQQTITVAEFDTYSWIGGTAGTWGNAPNWEDLTTGTVAAMAPGIGNVVTIGSGVTLSGTGSAYSVTWGGQDSEAGNVVSGQAFVDGNLQLESGATAVVTGTLQIGSGSVNSELFIADDAVVYANDLVLAGNGALLTSGTANETTITYGNGGVVIGLQSDGTAPDAPIPGLVEGAQVVIDSGHTLSGQGTVNDSIQDNGVIIGQSLTLGIPDVFYFNAAPHSGENSGYVAEFNEQLVGSGLVEIPTNGTVVLNSVVYPSGPAIMLDGSADLTVLADIDSGNTIAMNGGNNTVDISVPYLGYYGYFPPNIQGEITGFNASDVLLFDFGGRPDPLSVLSFNDGSLVIGDGTINPSVLSTVNFAGLDPSTTWDVTPLGNGVTAFTIACFAAGTAILTTRGEIPIERITTDDRLVLMSGATAPVKWIGHRRVVCRTHPEPHMVWPVRVSANAFANGRPRRDLWLSPEHAVFVDGSLIPVKWLINGRSIKQIPVDEITYYHIELPQHNVLLAEGLPAESYLNTNDRSDFANGGALARMHPNFSVDQSCEAIWEAAGFAPLCIGGETLERVATRLRRRATTLGLPAVGKTSRRRPAAHNEVATDLAELLDSDWYLAANPDVAQAGVDAATHYANWGRQEGRLPKNEIDFIRTLGLVDRGTVVFTMDDVVSAGLDPVVHFCTIGWWEGRRPNPYFDAQWYANAYDIGADTNPLLHYARLGEGQGLRPSRHFDPVWYRGHYGLGSSVSALAHYLRHRRTQQFSPLPTFDVASYVLTHAATLLPNRDPYAHYLAIGRLAKRVARRAAA